MSVEALGSGATDVGHHVEGGAEGKGLSVAQLSALARRHRQHEQEGAGTSTPLESDGECKSTAQPPPRERRPHVLPSTTPVDSGSSASAAPPAHTSPPGGANRTEDSAGDGARAVTSTLARATSSAIAKVKPSAYSLLSHVGALAPQPLRRIAHGSLGTVRSHVDSVQAPVRRQWRVMQRAVEREGAALKDVR